MPPKISSVDVLRRAPIFSDLSETELQFLAERAIPRNYAKGELVFSEGDPCAGLFIIEAGHLRIFKSSPSGREQVLASVGLHVKPATQYLTQLFNRAVQLSTLFGGAHFQNLRR